jgi:ParB/RepB/Spo0J family partition protein
VRQIVANTNPRDPLSLELQKDGYGVWKSKEGQPSLWSLATSDIAGDRAFYAHLIEERDPELASFAANILAVGQLQPVEVRDNGKKSGESTYTLVYGCRRCLAILYNWCVLGKPAEPVVEATLSKGNEVALMHRAISENIRRDPNAIEVAQSFQYCLNNGETKEEVAQRYGVSASTVSNRLALLDLPIATQNQIKAGKLKPTKALAAGGNGNAASPAKLKMRSRKEVEDRLQAAREAPGEDCRTVAKILAWVLQLPEG